jgi:alpha-ketoglutarate-dependent taurine dioxygenase
MRSFVGGLRAVHSAAHLFGSKAQDRVRWQPNMVLVWDNRCTYHSAIADYDARRYIERVTTGGEVRA